MTAPMHVQTTPVEVAGPLTSYLPAGGDGLAWLQGEDGLVGIGTAARLEVDHLDGRFARSAADLRAVVERATVEDPLSLPGTGLVAFGSFTFDPRSPGSRLVIPEVVIGRRAGLGWVTRITSTPTAPSSPPPPSLPPALPAPTTPPLDRPRFAGASIPDVDWLEAVAAAIRRIRSGRIDKVVLARDHALWSRAPFDPRRLCERLNHRFPGCLTFLVDGLVGATPELLVRRVGPRVESLALAGSAARGTDPEVDAKLGEALLASEKDRWEHELAARSVREVLADLCASIVAPGPPHLLRLDNVQHLATRVTGTLPGDLPPSALELAGALHPTAAVGGSPTDDAIAVIRELEAMDRGRYAGPVGWVDVRGDGEWGIALRCAELSGARARLFAGAGIVEGSLPEDELEETRLKLGAMLSAFEA